MGESIQKYAKVFRKFKCEFCNKRYVDQRCFKSHIEGHAGKKYTCECCPKWKFINILAYNHHLNFHMRGDNYLVCDICKDKFEESYQLASHKRKHKVAHCHVSLTSTVTKNLSTQVIREDTPELPIVKLRTFLARFVERCFKARSLEHLMRRIVWILWKQKMMICLTT